MKFVALILFSVIAVAYAQVAQGPAEEAPKKNGILGNFKDMVGSAIAGLPWNKKDAKLAAEVMKLALAAVESCKASTGISQEAVDALRTGAFLEQEVDETSKKFVSCYLEGLGFTKDGQPQINVIRQRLGAIVGQGKGLSTMFKCRSVGGDTPLDKSFNTYTCFFNNKAVVLE